MENLEDAFKENSVLKKTSPEDIHNTFLSWIQNPTDELSNSHIYDNIKSWIEDSPRKYAAPNHYNDLAKKEEIKIIHNQISKIKQEQYINDSIEFKIILKEFEKLKQEYS